MTRRWRRLVDGAEVEAARASDVCSVRTFGPLALEGLVLPHLDGRPGWVTYGGSVFRVGWDDWLVVDVDSGAVHPLPEATFLAAYAPARPTLSSA